MRKMLIIIIALTLTGCGATELEDRCFPMMAAVDYRAGEVEFFYGFPELSQKENTDIDESKVDAVTAEGESFEEAYGAYTKELSKLVDSNHMKVLVFGSAFVNSDEYENTLDYLRDTELFPRNTYVCMTDNTEALYGTKRWLPEDPGTYLESFLTRQSKEQGFLLADLGALLDARENGSAAPVLPYVEVKDGKAFCLSSRYIN